MERAFVVGATGYTGQAVVAALCARGVECHAHVRPDSSSLAAVRARFEAMGAQVDTTPWEPAALTATLLRVAPSQVFALLGTTRARMRRDGAADNSYERVDYGLTVMLLDAAVACGTRPQFVYLSSAGVSDSANAYIQARWKAEQRVAASGLPHLIVRPSFITGSDREESRPGERTAAVIANGALALAGVFGARRLRDRYSSISAPALADAMVRLALAGGASRIVHAEELRG